MQLSCPAGRRNPVVCVPVVRCAMFASTATASDMEGVLHCAGATSSYRHACYFHVSFFHFHSCCCMLMCVEYLYRFVHVCTGLVSVSVELSFFFSRSLWASSSFCVVVSDVGFLMFF